jgi:hypothetical protein
MRLQASSLDSPLCSHRPPWLSLEVAADVFKLVEADVAKLSAFVTPVPAE